MMHSTSAKLLNSELTSTLKSLNKQHCKQTGECLRLVISDSGNECVLPCAPNVAPLLPAPVLVRPCCLTLVPVAYAFRLSSPRRSISRPGPFGAEPLLDAARTHSLQRGAPGRNALPASAVALAAPGPLCRGAANAGAASERGTPRTAPSTLFAHDAATILGPRGDWLAIAKLTGGEASELGPSGFRCYSLRSWHPLHNSKLSYSPT